MDSSHIGIVATSLGVAKDIAVAMVGLRDFNLINEKAAALTQQLLQAQDALLSHNAAMLQLQNEHFKACEEIRKLTEALRERGRYSLVEVACGQFAYRMDAAPVHAEAQNPVSPHSAHYVCQRCFDKGVKSVLNSTISKLPTGWSKALICPECKFAIGVL